MLAAGQNVLRVASTAARPHKHTHTHTRTESEMPEHKSVNKACDVWGSRKLTLRCQMFSSGNEWMSSWSSNGNFGWRCGLTSNVQSSNGTTVKINIDDDAPPPWLIPLDWLFVRKILSETLTPKMVLVKIWQVYQIKPCVCSYSIQKVVDRPSTFRHHRIMSQIDKKKWHC